MKKLDKLVLGSFVGPFLMTSSIALFVIVMQFLWKYIDDMVGKGLEWYIIVELMFYASASFVPMALPLGVLLASIMTMGNLGEHYELVSFKAAGISLFRIMRSIMLFVMLVSVGTFLFANYLLPRANLKFGALLHDIRKQKPALNIQEGVFYTDIEGYTIKVGRKGADNRTIHDVIIFDHTGGRGNDNQLLAKSGEMINDDVRNMLVLKLYNGTQYQDMEPKQGGQGGVNEHLTTNFNTFEKRFDLSQFALERSEEDVWNNHYQMMNLGQLDKAIDTLFMAVDKKMVELNRNVNKYFTKFNGNLDSILVTYDTCGFPPIISNTDLLALELDTDTEMEALKRSLSFSRNAKSFVGIGTRDMKYRMERIAKHEIEMHRKFTVAIACLVFFFIGAPLGAIIRKGGLGMPLLFCIMFFVIMHVFNMIGEKGSEELAWSSATGMWMSTMVLLPIGVFLSIKAMNDSKLFSGEWYYSVISKLLPKKKQ